MTLKRQLVPLFGELIYLIFGGVQLIFGHDRGASGDFVFSFLDPLQLGQLEPFIGLDVISFDAPPLAVHFPETELGSRVTLSGGPSVPQYRFGQVRRTAQTFFRKLAKGIFGAGVSLVGSPTKPFGGSSKVFLGVEEHGVAVLSLGTTVLGGLLEPFKCLVFILFDTQSLQIESAEAVLGQSVPLFGGTPKPLLGLGIILPGENKSFPTGFGRGHGPFPRRVNTR